MSHDQRSSGLAILKILISCYVYPYSFSCWCLGIGLALLLLSCNWFFGRDLLGFVLLGFVLLGFVLWFKGHWLLLRFGIGFLLLQKCGERPNGNNEWKNEEGKVRRRIKGRPFFIYYLPFSAILVAVFFNVTCCPASGGIKNLYQCMRSYSTCDLLIYISCYY